MENNGQMTEKVKEGVRIIKLEPGETYVYEVNSPEATKLVVVNPLSKTPKLYDENRVREITDEVRELQKEIYNKTIEERESVISTIKDLLKEIPPAEILARNSIGGTVAQLGPYITTLDGDMYVLGPEGYNKINLGYHKDEGDIKYREFLEEIELPKDFEMTLRVKKEEGRIYLTNTGSKEVYLNLKKL